MKKSGGITLIALVITMAIMLILATISVTVLSGNNGLINKAGQAKEGAEEKNERDIINQAITAVMNNNIYGELVAQELADELNYNYGEDDENKSEIKLTAIVSENIVSVCFEKSGRNYIIDEDGNVTKEY